MALIVSTTNDYHRHLAERIDKLEAEMQQMIRIFAEKAREKLRRLSNQQMTGASQYYDEDSNDFSLICAGGDFYESNLNELTNEIEQINYELNAISGDENSKIELYIPPMNWSNVFESNINNRAVQNRDIYELRTTTIIEFQKVRSASDENSKLKAIQRKPKTIVDIANGSNTRVATSEHYLLHGTFDKLYAIEVNTMNQQNIPWGQDDWIIDVCYSTFLQLFMIWSNSGFYTFDLSTMRKQQTIENVLDTGTGWYRCACYADSLFLSYDCDIQQRKIQADEHEYLLLKAWKSVLKDDDEVIRDMKLNEFHFLLGVGKNGKSCCERFELRDYGMNILHTLDLDVCDIASLPNAKWLIVTETRNKLIMMNNNGETEETIQYQCRNRVLQTAICGSNKLVVGVRNQLHIHDLQNDFL